MTEPGGARVINAKRSKLMADRWKDPTKGPDGLTYRERRQKAAREQRDRELQARKGGDAPTKIEDPAPSPPSPPAPGPTPPAKSERRGYTGGRAWRP